MAILDVSTCPTCLLWDPPFSPPSSCSFPSALEDYTYPDPPIEAGPLRGQGLTQGASHGQAPTRHGKWGDDRISLAVAPLTSPEQVSEAWGPKLQRSSVTLWAEGLCGGVLKTSSPIAQTPSVKAPP